MPEFSIVIPQHGRSDLTCIAVNSLLQTQREQMEVIVVDDGSSLAELEPLRALSGHLLSLVRLPRRRGVTVAWNLGARVAHGKTLVFLNNDTVSLGPWLKQLAWPVRSGAALLAGPAVRRERQLSNPDCRLLKGWCLAIQRETFFSVGMFDERFCLYFSDTDLQLRLLRHSAEALACCPKLPIRHLGRSSTRQLLSRNREWRRDRDRFRQKWSLFCSQQDSGQLATFPVSLREVPVHGSPGEGRLLP